VAIGPRRLSGGTLKPYIRRSALHLLRRLEACHRGDIPASGGAAGGGKNRPCQFSESEAARLREIILDRELNKDWGDLALGETAGVSW